MAYLGILLAVLSDNAVRLLAPDLLWLQTAPPDLLLVTAIYIGFKARDSGQLGLAIWMGLLTDCFSAAPLGHFAFLYGTTAYLALRLRRYVPPDAFVTHLVVCLLCGLLTALLALLLAVLTVRGPIAGGFERACLGAVSSALLAPFIFGLWDRSRFFRRALGGRSYEFA